MAIIFSEYFSTRGSYAVFQPKGQFTFDEAVDIIDEAVAYCRDNDIRGLLVDVTGITGFPPPTTTQRFQFATKWATTSAGKVVLSMIAAPEMIDHEKLGVTVANNRGLTTEVFTTESDAINWLLPQCIRPPA